jgi:hypothetical protein
MPRTREKILEERRRLKAEHGELFDAISALLFRRDPVGINFEINNGEYDTEADTILPRLRSCQTSDDVLRVVHEEFIRWFDLNTARSQEGYIEIASEIWKLWQKFRSDPQITTER